MIRAKGNIILESDIVQQIALEYIDRVPESARAARVARDGPRFHVTVVYNATSASAPSVPPAPESEYDVFPLGLCCKESVYYVPVVFPEGEKLSPGTDFHITLGFSGRDRHDFPKNLAGLLELHPCALDVLGRSSIAFTARLADACTRLYSSGQFSARTLTRLAMWHGRRNEIERCLQLVPALSEIDPLAAFYVRMQLDRYLRKDLIPLVHEMATARAGLPAATILSEKQLHTLWEGINGCYELYFMRSDDEDVYRPHKLPMNFSGVFKESTDPCFGIFGSGEPSSKYAHVLADMGIVEVVTLTEDRCPLTTHHLPTPDREPPTLEGTRAAIAVIESSVLAGRRVLVHCLGGVGRTNTLIACYVLHVAARRRAAAEEDAAAEASSDASGHAAVPPHLTGSPADAIAYVASLRPKMILSQSQVSFVHEFAELLASGVLPPQQAPHRGQLPQLVLMCGYPCSGKSTVSQALVNRLQHVKRLSGDELGRRALVEALGASMPKKGAGGGGGGNGGVKTVIVDRCHLTHADRAEMWALAFKPERALILWLDVPHAECVDRTSRRVGHKLSEGDSASVVASLAGKLEPPTEPWATVVRLSGDDDVRRFFEGLGVPAPRLPKAAPDAPSAGEAAAVSGGAAREEEPFIRKFVRTRHLVNLGSATRDDLVLEAVEAQALFCGPEVFVEEKVDGANLGFSLFEGSVRAQNRSHYVNSSSHTQFKQLDKWILKHNAALLDILHSGSGRMILYGEWLFAKHSVPYTRLPDLFLAFDLFDIAAGRFVSRPVLEARLAGSGISLVPLVARTHLAKPQDAARLIRGSAFYDGPAEGVYVRVCDADWTIQRAKVVRPDFLSGDEHWSKHSVVPNGILPQY